MAKVYRLFLVLICVCGTIGCGTTSPRPSLPNVTEAELLVYEKTATGLSSNEAATLESLELVDGYPLYTMRFIGKYEGNQSVAKDDPVLKKQEWGCSLFAALGDKDNMFYGRNFDWQYSPALLLFTDPPDGYASVTMVDMAYLGIGSGEVKNLTTIPLEARRPLLLAPFYPFDGMNEHGLVVGMAAVPDSKLFHDPGLATIGSLRVIREMLDHARSVEEAVAILQKHNISFTGGPQLHYLIADSTGNAVLVEFVDDSQVLIPNVGDWHVATNFLLSSTDEFPRNKSPRYRKISKFLRKKNGAITQEEALHLLAKVDQADPPTQWSIVYRLNSGDISVVMGRSFDTIHSFHLDLATE